MIYLDTHAVAWLYAKELSRFTNKGLESLEANELLISPMVTLELEYLYETGRIQVKSRVICESLKQTVGLRVCDLPFAGLPSQCSGLALLPLPFGRHDIL